MGNMAANAEIERSGTRMLLLFDVDGASLNSEVANFFFPSTLGR